jgi:hypothetical protein
MTTPDGERVLPSWAPIDLTSVLDGTDQPQPPTYMTREDGVALLYPGKVHQFMGEAESGKSMLMHAEIARAIRAGQPVLLIDFESDQGTVVSRLRMLGAAAEQIRANLHYLRPDVDPRALTAELQAWKRLLETRYALAVIDGVTEAFAVYGVKSIDNDEVTAWGRAVPRQIAQRTGAAVVVVDHVTKDADTRGRFAIGAQAKMSYLTGASYSVEILSPIGVGMAGQLAIRVGKDRPGLVRPHSGAWRKSDRTQEVAVATIDSTEPGSIRYSLGPHRTATTADSTGEWKPSAIMGQISQALEDAKKPLTLGQINALVRGKRETINAAIQELEQGGHISIKDGPRNARLHILINPYPEGARSTAKNECEYAPV